MPHHPADRLGLEELGAVLPRRVQAALPLAHAEQEVELRPPLLVHELGRTNSSRLELRPVGLPVRIVEHDHRLEDGRLAQSRAGFVSRTTVSYGRSALPKASKYGAACSGQQLREAGVTREVEAKCKWIDEIPDHVFELAAIPPGERSTKDDVLLARVASEHGTE